MNGETKPGWKSTEFWGKALVQGIVLWNSFKEDSQINPELGLTIIAFIEGVYGASRSVVKGMSKKE